MHLLQYAFIARLQGKLTLLLDFKGIGRAWMVEIVSKRGNEGIKPLFFCETAPQCLRSVVGLVKELSG